MVKRFEQLRNAIPPVVQLLRKKGRRQQSLRLCAIASALAFPWALGVSPCWRTTAHEAPPPDASETTSTAGRNLLEQAGLWPLPSQRPDVATPRARLRNHSGYSVENVALETAPGCFCTGNLYRPLLRHNLTPAMLWIDDADPSRRYANERQIACAHLARMGVTVLACRIEWEKTPVDRPPRARQAVPIWNGLRAIDFLTRLARIDVQQIGVVGEGAENLKQVDQRIALAIQPTGDLSPPNRQSIYTECVQRFLLRPDPFFAEEFTQAREPEPQPRENPEKIALETPEELTQFDEDPALQASQTMTNDKAVEIIFSLLRSLQVDSQSLRAAESVDASPLAEYVEPPLTPADEAIVFTPPGFDRAGVRKTADGARAGQLEITIVDGATGRPASCRVNVVGPDGNFYEPASNSLKEHSYTSEWPTAGWGNRPLRAPVRYLGRPFYTTGQCSVAAPAGSVRIEVWKGLEYRPETVAILVAPGKTHRVEIALTKGIAASDLGYWSGDPHIHIQRRDDADQGRIFDLLECEDTRYGALLAYNEPAGPYHGQMKRMDSPQWFGLGARSIASRGDYAIVSGQEYRSNHYGHMNIYLLNQLVLDGQSLDADGWPPFGLVARSARESGGIAVYAHGGYAQEIFADVAQGDVDGVELLQHGVYRGLGLAGWYRMLNAGYRISAHGAADYPACRMLADCKTYVSSQERPTMEEWLRGMAAGRSFFTSGPLVFLEVDGERPGAMIDKGEGESSTSVAARIRVRSEVTPVTHVQLIVNGRIVAELTTPNSQGQGNWLELQREIELSQSAWIAARAFSQSPHGAANAEAHTNPVYVYLNGKAPYDRASLDGWLAALDRQIAVHAGRKFDGQARTLAYFERSRDILTKIRAAGGAPAAGHPADLAQELPTIDDPTSRRHEDEKLGALLKPVPPQPFDAFLKSIETVNGFEVQPVAREPLVYDPIAGAFDEQGNLYVCEMRDYPYKPAAGKLPLGGVRLLRDLDGDGVFDESHVFAENLLWAGGVAPWRGGVFVAAPPDIWYLKDTDGDFRADVRRQAFTGFGTQNQQAMLNNLTLGLDHKIYGSTAGNGGKVRCVMRPADGQPLAQPEIDVRGRDFRFDPDTGEFEAITGTMQFGNAFDDWGNRFLCSESQPLLHALLPHHYLVRNPHLLVPYAIHNIAPGPVPIFRTSPIEGWRIIRSSRRIAHGERSAVAPGASHHVIDAAAGVTIYRGGAYPAEYYGNVFVPDAQNNLIHRRTLTPSGVTFQSERVEQNSEFVRSSDNWFRPVNLLNAPDGTLYALDMSREILETIHVPSDVAKRLDFTSGRQHGRILRLAPRGFRYPGPPNLGGAPTKQLVAALESPHGWQRDTAHRLLFERRDATAIQPLQALLAESRLPQARLHALWSLAGLGALDAHDLLRSMADEHAALREHAARLAESQLDESPALLERLTTFADDADPRVRFQAAFSLGQSTDRRAAMALARLARTSASDPWIRTAILSSASELAYPLLSELEADETLSGQAEGSSFLAQLAAIVGARNRPAEIGALLDQWAVRAGVAPSSAGTSESSAVFSPGATDALLVAVGQGLKQQGARLDVASDSSRGMGYLRAALAHACSVAADETVSLQQRLAAIELLSCASLGESRAALTHLLDPRQPSAIQVAVVRSLADYGEADIGALLLDRWRQYAPDVRGAAVAGLLARTERARQLLEAVVEGDVSLAQLDATQRAQLADHPDPGVRTLAAEVFSASVDSREQIVASYAAKLNVDSEPQRGAAVFRRECMTCHKIGDVGRPVGPDLTASSARDPEALLAHILDPNRHVLPNYENYLCVDHEGRVTTGMLAAQTATSVTLVRQEQETTTILRANIDELASTGKSLMPEGFERTIGKQEMVDLIAYLRSSQGPVAAEPLEIGTEPGMLEPAN